MRREPRGGRRYVALDGSALVATLTLGARKPWAIDRTRFSAVRRPLYLTDLVVDPARQGTGIGRRCVEEACQAARDWPGDAIFLDAYDAPAGAGEFYRRAGFREVGRASYRGVPLIYFERLLS
jgi:GNAT superfamily N-acetyltransferase